MSHEKNIEFHLNSEERILKGQSLAKDLALIAGVMNGICADGIVTDDEVYKTLLWLQSLGNKVLLRPYSDILQLVTDCQSDGGFTTQVAKEIIGICDCYISSNRYYTDATTEKQTILGIITGIAIDGQINDDEVRYLNQWLNENTIFNKEWPFNELALKLSSCVADKIVSVDDRTDIIAYCNAISANSGVNNTSVQLLIGAQTTNPITSIQGKTFCITGKSKKYKRSELEQRIVSHGGIAKDQVTTTLNYLIICEEKNISWAYTSYGNKIKEVLHNNDNGSATILAHELDLLEALSAADTQLTTHSI